MGIFDFIKGHRDSQKDDSQMKDKERYTDNHTFDKPETTENHVGRGEPPCDGLYPEEVLVLSYAPRYYVTGNDFPQFWLYKYSIGNVQEVLDSLLQRGYIAVGTIEDAVMSESLSVIKEELKKHDIKTTGKKKDLVQRLIENVPEDELSEDFVKRPYILTERGENVVKKYEWIPYIHAHEIEDLDIWNLTQLVQNSNYINYRDCIWGYLQSQSLKHIKNGNYGLYRNCLFEMAIFVEEEGRLEEAFELLCEVCVYDLNDAYNNFSALSIDIDFMAKSCFPYDTSMIKLPPGIIRLLKKYKSRLCWDETTTKGKIEHAILDVDVPFRIFKNDECVNIILGEIDGNTDEVAKIYENAERRFRKTYHIK